MQVLIAGASGLLGRALTNALMVPSIANRFHPAVYHLVRRKPQNDKYWPHTPMCYRAF